MYSDSELITCSTCGSKGIYAPNTSGVETFFHKIDSPRLEGYFTFTEFCQIEWETQQIL